MSVLIKGMSFPTKENFMTQLYLICDKDGNWYAVDTTNKNLYKLIEIKEPHGKLIDADELYGAIVDKGQRNERGKYRIGEYWELTGREIREVINGQSPVIDAEGATHE